jgi:type IV pilus assembly protein PilW
MKKQILTGLSKQGFTLVELLVAMGISGVVMAGIYTIYNSQQKSYVAQEQIVAMQQNLRTAMYVMEREIRMAGYDPTRATAAGITIANVAELQLTKDENGDGDFTNPSPPPANDTNEQVRYALTDDANEDGIADGSPCHLGRETWAGGLQMIAENIDALNFVYLDEDGNPTATLSDIRSIQITIVARAGRVDQGYTDTNAYYNQWDLVNPILAAQNDGFRRKRLTTEVKCRNLGLD